MAKDRFAPKPLESLLGKYQGRLGQIAQKSESIQDYQGILEMAIGAKIAPKCRVANVRDDVLIIETASGAITTTLNYVKMDILSTFRQNGLPGLVQVKVVTNPELIKKAAPQKPLAPRKAMSQKTQEAILAVAQNAPASLQEKLTRLARHADKQAQKKR